MTDPKLIEAVARAIGRSVMHSRAAGKQTVTDSEFEWEWNIPQWRKACEDAATAALAAIDASGEWWVAPVTPSGETRAAGMLAAGSGWPSALAAYHDMRIAYLAKPEEMAK